MASMAPSQPWQPSQPPPQPAAQQELTEPVKESAEPVPGANGRQGGKPEMLGQTRKEFVQRRMNACDF